MSEPKKSNVAAWIAFVIAVLVGTTVVVVNKDTPATDTAVVVTAPPVVETIAPPTETVATETIPPTDTAPPVTDTQPPEPPPIVTEPDEDTIIAGRIRPVNPPSTCNVEEIATAERYSHEPGYEYLLNRCDLIRQWRAGSGDVVVWLARHGYNSPLARCPRRFIAQSNIPPESWNAVRVEHGGEIKYARFAAGQWVDRHMEFVIEFPCTTAVMRTWPESERTAVFGWHQQFTVHGPDGTPYLATGYAFKPDVLPVAISDLPIPDLRFQ